LPFPPNFFPPRFSRCIPSELEPGLLCRFSGKVLPLHVQKIAVRLRAGVDMCGSSNFGRAAVLSFLLRLRRWGFLFVVVFVFVAFSSSGFSSSSPFRFFARARIFAFGNQRRAKLLRY